MRPTSRLLRRAMKMIKGPGLVGVIGRGAAGNSVVNGVGAVVLIAVQLLLARYLGAEEFGYFLYAQTLLNVVSLLARLGLDTAQIRYVAAYRAADDPARLAGLLRFGDGVVFVSGVATGIAAAGLVWLLEVRLGWIEAPLARTLWAASACLPLVGLMKMRGSALQGLKHVGLSPLPESVVRPILLLSLASAHHFFLAPLTGARAMVLYAFALAGAAAVGTVLRRRRLPADVLTAEPRSESREWSRTGLSLVLVSGMRFLLAQTDILLVGALAGTTAAGIYGVASRISRLISFGLMAGNSIVAPLISELYSQNQRRELQKAVTIAAWGTTVWAALAAVFLAVISPWLLGYYGEEFRAGVPILLLLAFGQVINSSTGPVGYLLNMTGHERDNARILAWIASLNAVMSAGAILTFGPIGAAAVTGLLIGTKNLWTWWVVRRLLGVNSSIFSTWTREVEGGGVS